MQRNKQQIDKHNKKNYIITQNEKNIQQKETNKETK